MDKNRSTRKYSKLVGLFLCIPFLFIISFGTFFSQKQFKVYHLWSQNKIVYTEWILKSELSVDDAGEAWQPFPECSECLLINTSEIGVNKFMVPENFVNVRCGDVKKGFLKDNKIYKRTALASIPGSGNTWVRYLIEEITGIHTGSIYNSTLIGHQFIGENTTDGVIAIKTHKLWNKYAKYERAILIVRDPFESALAERNRQNTASKTGTIDYKHFNQIAFTRNLGLRLRDWQHFNRNWLLSFPGPVFVLFYDRLKSDLRNSLANLSRFLGTEITLHKLWCVGIRREGSFHRPPKPDWMSRSNLVTNDLELRIQNAWQGIVDICKNSTNRNKITTNL